MNKADKFKLLYIFGISLIFYFVGCVDTSVDNIPTTFDFHSQVQVVNLASVNGTATIDIVNADGTTDATTGQLNVGDTFPADGQAFQDVPSGAKTVKVTFGSSTSSIRLTLDTERKMRLFLYNPDQNSVDIIKGVERYTWQEKNSDNSGDLFPPDTASISFFNASPDVSVDSIFVQGVPVDLSASLSVGESTSYIPFTPVGNYAVTFKDTTDLASASKDLQSQGRYTAILYGTQGNLQAKIYTDD